MKPVEVRTIAGSRGSVAGSLLPAVLMRVIQAAGGSIHCFATARDGICEHAECPWRGDCLAAIRKGVLS